MREPVTLELSGQGFELKPDFARLVELEKIFGQPLLDIADIFIGNKASLTLIAETLAIILAWPPAARGCLGDEIVAAGVGRVLKGLQGYFLATLGIADRN
jgi:hypothetical protein